MKLAWKNSGKLNQTNLILAGFNHLEPLCGCCCEIILMYCSFFSFPPTLTILHHHTKQIIAWFAPMLFIHQHNCIKKTTTPCAPPLQTEGPNFVSITAITYILQLPSTKKHPLFILLLVVYCYINTLSLYFDRKIHLCVLRPRCELKFWVLWNWIFFLFFLCKKTSRIYPWKKFPLIYMHQSLNLKILHPSCAYFWLPQESPFLELFMDHVGSWLQKHLENKWLGMTKRGNQ